MFQTLAVPHRQLRQLTPLFEVHDPNKKEKSHQRIVFVFNDKVVVSKNLSHLFLLDICDKVLHFYCRIVYTKQNAEQKQYI